MSSYVFSPIHPLSTIAISYYSLWRCKQKKSNLVLLSRKRIIRKIEIRRKSGKMVTSKIQGTLEPEPQPKCWPQKNCLPCALETPLVLLSPDLGYSCYTLIGFLVISWSCVSCASWGRRASDEPGLGHLLNARLRLDWKALPASYLF